LLRVFIGYDKRESVAASVLAYSIHKRCSVPVSITFLDKEQIPQFQRPHDPLASTAFTYARFLVPWLCNYEGKAVFMDCDMMALADLAPLLAYPEEGHAITVVQHDYQPENETKFLGAKQTRYPRKLWSALMVFDNTKCKALTPEYVATATGAELHQLRWLDDSQIGELSECWQWIPDHSRGEPKIIHWTEGGPYFRDYANAAYASTWKAELAEMSWHEAA